MEVKRDLESINMEIKQTEKAIANLLVRDIHTRASMQRLLIQLRQNKDLMIRRLTALEREEKFGIREKELGIEKLEVEIERAKDGVDDKAIISLLGGLNWMANNYSEVRDSLIFPEDIGGDGEDEENEED